VKFQYSYDEAENRVLLLCVLPKNLRWLKSWSRSGRW
jgi:hypothetical protein